MNLVNRKEEEKGGDKPGKQEGGLEGKGNGPLFKAISREEKLLGIKRIGMLPMIALERNMDLRTLRKAGKKGSNYLSTKHVNHEFLITLQKTRKEGGRKKRVVEEKQTKSWANI